MAKSARLLLGLMLGIGLGGVAHYLDAPQIITPFTLYLLQPIGQIFLRLIFMVVVPLVFAALVLGVFELGQSRGLKAIAIKTIFYTVIVSSISVFIGITLVNIFQPGKQFTISIENQALIAQNSTMLSNIKTQAASAKPIQQLIVELIPKNPLNAAVHALDGEMLSLMVFALIFGIALSSITLKSATKPVLIALLEELFAACMRIIDFAMTIAPFGVFAIVFNTIYQLGLGVLLSLFVYVAIVVAGLLIQQFGVYSLLLKFVAKRSPWQFFKACQSVYLYAFSTASSNATLPEAIDTAENKLNLPPQIARFVLTVGSTANQNGTALFEGVTVLFLAQIYAIDLTMSEQIRVVLMSILAGIGTAGVPGGSLPLIVILLQSVGIPAEGIGLILGVDRFLDMCRTTVNVSGDLVIAALVSDNAVVLSSPRRGS